MLEILDAAAGAGKTYNLAKRFLELLAKAHGESPTPPCLAAKDPGAAYAFDDILAITFTNKAAAEMQERVLLSLKERALAPPDAPADGPAASISPERARQWLDLLIRRMNRLNIRTIDSLLHRVLRLGALELGLPPNVELEFDPGELFDPLFATLESQAMQEDADNAPMHALLEKAVDTLLRVRGCKRFLPAPIFDQALREVFAFLLVTPMALQTDDEQVRQLLIRLHAELQAATEAMLEAMDMDTLDPVAHFSNYLGRLQDCGLYDLPYKSAYASKECLAACLKKACHGRISPQSEAVYASLRQAHAHKAGLTPILRKAISLTQMAAICAPLFQNLEVLQRVRGVTPMARLPLMTHRLLADQACVSEALCRMGNALRHLLLDEFQDTSREQWHSLEPLACEVLSKRGSLFYVGDVKQAIYGWRGGDARLFNEIQDSPALAPLLEGPPKRDALPTNWRSAPTIVEFNNEFFGRLAEPDISRHVAEALLPANLDAEEGAVVDALAANIRDAYKNVAQEVAPKNKGRKGLVRLLDIRADNKDELLEKVKERLHDLLDELLQRARPGEIALLVRKNDQAELAAQWLMEWGHAVITENSLLLEQHPLVRQLVALGSFLDYPLDDVAFHACVSSREFFLDACGLPFEELNDWLAQRRKGPLYLQFRQRFPAVWAQWLEPLFLRGGFMSAYDVFADAIQRFDLRHRFPNDVIYCNRLLETAHAAESEGAHSLAAFLELWRQSGDQLKVPLPENIDAIRVITIHKAKGLQFPVVVVPFHHSGKPPGEDLVAWWPPGSHPEQELPVLAPLSRGLGQVYWEHALPDLQEQLNLLYVAWTRAERELHCCITSARYYETNSPALRALRVLLGPYDLDGDGDSWEKGEVESQATPPPAAKPPEPLPSAWREPGAEPMDWLPRLKIYRSELHKEAFAQRRRGTLYHRCLEHLRVRDSLEADVERALRAGLRGLSDPHDPAAFAKEQEQLKEELRPVLAWVRGHEQLRTCLAAGATEQEVLTPHGAIRRMDLLAEVDGRLMAVEYKTGGENPEHLTQLRDYLQLLAALPAAAATPPLGLLVYLDQRRIQHVEP